MVDSRQGSLAKPLSLLFLACRSALSSQQRRTLVCLFWSGNLHSPANPTAAHQAQAATAQTTLSPSHPVVPRVTILSTSSVRTMIHNNSSLQTSSHPQNSASHLLGLQGPQQTPAFVRGITYWKKIIHFGKKSLAKLPFHHSIPNPSTALLLYLSLLRQTTQMVKHPLSLHQMSYAIYCPIEVPSYTIASALLTMSL